jgi:glucose/arabinose dehydrogenase
MKILPLASLMVFLSGQAIEAAFPPLKLELVCEKQIDSPVAMVSPADGSGRMFVVDQRGKIRIFRNGMLEPGLFLDLGPKLVSERAGFDERGLLGLAFHPGFADSGSPGHRRFYVFYIAPSPNAPGTTSDPVDSREVIAEYQVSAGNADLADAASERVLLAFDKPQFNHNGGGLEFGPDGFLYFSVGDGGSSNDNNAGHTGGSTSRPTNALGNAQDLTKWNGKIHRIDPLGNNGSTGEYGIPAENPFASSPNGERPEIFAYGLRNPWRFSFDSRAGGTNRLFCADVGQGQVEEIDLIVNGGNYGWRNKEGTFFPSFSSGAPALGGNVVDPISQYAHPGVVIGSPALPEYGISVTGGYVYRGSAIPALAGKYVFADWSQSFGTPRGRMLGLEETTPGVFSLSSLDILGGNPTQHYIQGFGQDEGGELFVLARTTLAPSAPNPGTGLPSGKIYKIVPLPATQNITLTTGKDNTIYEEVTGNSNGSGVWIFAGAINNNPGPNRRALISFNLGTVPAGGTVATASLTLKMDKTIAGAFPFSLHSMLKDWGEGTANAAANEGDGVAAGSGDATWLKPFFGQPAVWDAPGGDFSLAKSASTAVNGDANYSWVSPQLAYDLNAWLASPDSNYGWLLKADDEDTFPTAKRFASFQAVLATSRPKLAITYVPAPVPSRRRAWELAHYFIGEYINDATDTDGDGIDDGIEYAWGFSPKAAQPMSAGLSVDYSGLASGNAMEITFRRDPLATDLTYELQVSGDLDQWTTVATSAGGVDPSGSGYLSESVIAGQEPYRAVLATDVPPPEKTKRFVRLKVTRN